MTGKWPGIIFVDENGHPAILLRLYAMENPSKLLI